MAAPPKRSAACAWAEAIGDTVWHEFTPLAARCNAVNLSQGFPGWAPPQFVIDAAQKAIAGECDDLAKSHQYAKPTGHPFLAEKLVELYTPLVKVKLQAENFQITTGASGGLWTTIHAFVEKDDEVILMTPYFDIYEGDVLSAGGKVVEVPILLEKSSTNSGENSWIKTSAEYKLDTNALRKAINQNTKAIILNSPHNPLGKVFSREELEEIAKIIKESGNDRLIVISDEVYEFMVFDGVKFERFCTLDGMWDRTVTISSGGKTFSTTGWKIGWVYGPVHLLKPVQNVHNLVAFSISTPLQIATAYSIQHALKNNYFETLSERYKEIRDIIVDALTKAGMRPTVPTSTFYVTCHIEHLFSKIPPEWNPETATITKMNLNKKDWNFCRWLTAVVGVAAIPCSAFYRENPPEGLIRIAFPKPKEQIEEAIKRILNHFT